MVIKKSGPILTTGRKFATFEHMATTYEVAVNQLPEIENSVY